MSNRMRASAWCLAVVFSGLMHGHAHALMAENLMMGNPKALALGNAVTADPPGIDAIHFNPAGLSRLDGRQLEVKAVGAYVEIGFETRSTPAYEAYLDQIGINFDDPYRNASASADSIALMLPGIGVAEMPTGTVAGAVLGGVSFQPYKSRLTFANAIYAPLVGGYSYDDDSVGKFAAREVGISRITYLSPSVAYKLSDTLSVGASVGFSYVGFGMDLDARVSHFLYGYASAISGVAGDLCDLNFGGASVDYCALQINPFEGVVDVEIEAETFFSPSFNLGVLWDATPWLAFGLTYRKGASDRLEGEVSLTYADSLQAIYGSLCGSGGAFPSICSQLLGLPNGISTDKRDVALNLEWPDYWALGTSIKVTPRWKVNFDVKYLEASSWDEFIIEFEEPIPVLELVKYITPNVNEDRVVVPRGYEDVWSWSVGTEYQLSERLAVRFGYEPRESAIPDDKLDHIVPIGDSKLYSAGLSYQFSRQTVIDFGMGYLVSKQEIPAGSSSNLNASTGNTYVYSPFGGLDVETRLEAYLVELGIRSTF